MYEFVLENGFGRGLFSGQVGSAAEGFVRFGVARDHQPITSGEIWSGEDFAFGVDLGDALQRDAVAGAAVVGAVGFGEAGHAIVGVVHGELEALVDFLKGPLFAAAILDPLVITHSHAASVAQHIGQNLDAAALQDFFAFG